MHHQFAVRPGSFSRLLILLVLASLLTGCLPFLSDSGDDISGAILVWHDWPAPESSILNELLDNFSNVHPNVVIVREYVPSDQLSQRFLTRVASGMGPDVLIGTDLRVMADLVDAGLILDLAPYELDTSELQTLAVSALRLGDGLYGLPFSSHTNVLYYNKRLVDRPFTTLDELLIEAQAGETINIPIDFANAYWGVKAFGGELLNDEGRIVIGEGFIHWLEWLLEAQNQPTIILNNQYEDLINAFAQGEAAYFVGHSIDLPYLIDQLGAENVGIARLPSGEYPAGAFLELEVISVNHNSAEREIGVQLAQFLTNRTQQRRLALSNYGQIPVNFRVRFDSRLAPTPAELKRQSTNTVIVPLPIVRVGKVLRDVGDGIYLKTLEGELDPVGAAVQLAEELNNFAASQTANP